MLSDIDIKEALMRGDIDIDPYHVAQLQPASYDLTLNFPLKSRDGSEMLSYGDFVRIDPGEFMLAATLEELSVGLSYVARLEGKSSWARLGLIVHAAGFIDPGWSGPPTLELANVGDAPIFLCKGDAICQVAFDKLDTPASMPYNGNYVGSTGARVSRFLKNQKMRGQVYYAQSMEHWQNERAKADSE